MKLQRNKTLAHLSGVPVQIGLLSTGKAYSEMSSI